MRKKILSCCHLWQVLNSKARQLTEELREVLIEQFGSSNNGEETTAQASLRLPFTPRNLPFLTV
jgi:hypothetical protein